MPVSAFHGLPGAAGPVSANVQLKQSLWVPRWRQHLRLKLGLMSAAAFNAVRCIPCSTFAADATDPEVTVVRPCAWVARLDWMFAASLHYAAVVRFPSLSRVELDLNVSGNLIQLSLPSIAIR